MAQYKVSVVVPYHDESAEFMKPLLRSLDEQVGINFDEFEFIFTNDLQDREPSLDKFDFTEYPNLKHIKHVKSSFPANPGLSRQAGIDEALGEYVFFLDADDSLMKIDAFLELIKNIEDSHADLYSFQFIEQVIWKAPDGQVYQQYDLKDCNLVWVFAKAYRTQFLREKNIRFSKQLRWHEDTYFNILFRFNDPKIVTVRDPIYLWRCNPNSITRKNNHEYTFSSRIEYLDSLDLGFTYTKDVLQKNFYQMCLSGIVDTYCLLATPRYVNDPDLKEKYFELEQHFYNFIMKFMPTLLTEPITGNVERVIIQQLRNIRDFIPAFTITEYFKSLHEKFSSK